MAEVFLATSSGLGGFKKRLVIKRLLPHLEASPRFTKMFLEEARVAALLDHPHLAQVWDCGELDGRHYLAMEYIDGATLAELVKVHSSFDPRIAAAIAVDLLDALHAVHTATDHHSGEPLRLVHRDVTPRNVMVTLSGIVKLLDLGIAVPAGVAHGSMGTIKYMSPEQVAGLPLDARSDLYSVGLVLYFLITGRPAFEDANRGPVARPERMPEDLWAIIVRALAPEIVDRFTTARQMQAQLEALLERWGKRPARARLADLVETTRPSAAMQALTRVTRLTRSVFTVGEILREEQSQPPRPPPAQVSRYSRHVGFAVIFAVVAGIVLIRWPVSAPPPEAAPVVEPAPVTAPAPATVLVPEPAPVRREEPPPLPPPSPPAVAIEPVEPPPPVRAPKKTKIKKEAGLGYLTIDTRPWTEITVDGKPIGTTPLERIEVKSGVRRVGLKNKQFGIETELEVHVKPDQVSPIRKTFRTATRRE